MELRSGRNSNNKSSAPTTVNPEDICTCNSKRCSETKFSSELDNFLNPVKIFKHYSQIEKAQVLTDKPSDLEGILAKLAEYKPNEHCAYAWPSGYIAFRCRTCSSSPTTSFCVDCFRNGDHYGHDYNMFKSRAGGACDCGYPIVEESGHCRNHGKNAVAQKLGEDVPAELICRIRRSIPRIIHRLAIQLRRSHVNRTRSGELEIYLDFLIKLMKSSVILRDLMVETLISEDVYKSQIELFDTHKDPDFVRIFREGMKKLEREKKLLAPFAVPHDWPTKRYQLSAFRDDFPINCFLEELMFWNIVSEFPQKLVCFLLGFLMNENYKSILSKAYINNYPRITIMIAGSRCHPRAQNPDPYEQMSRRVVQVSVQIFNDRDLTLRLCEDYQVLRTLVYCIRIAIEGSQQSGMYGCLNIDMNNHCDNIALRTVKPEERLIRNRHLASLNEDFGAILGLDREAERLIKDKDIHRTWLEMLSYFQGMDTHLRLIDEHTPYDRPGRHFSNFNVENDFCLGPLGTILSPLKHPSKLRLAQALLHGIEESLSDWLIKSRTRPGTRLNPYVMTFHIPLHRMYGATLRFIKYYHDCGEDTHMSDDLDYIRALILHPLQALTFYHEIRTGMWVRNGLRVLNRAVTYAHSSYCYSTIDLDMFMLRFCGSRLEPVTFLKTVMSRFHAWKWFSFRSNSILNNQPDVEQRLYRFNITNDEITLMVENALALICQILTLDIHCNISEDDQIRQEIVSILSVEDRSYSMIADMIPDVDISDLNLPNNRDLKPYLDDLANFRPAQHGASCNLQQGIYSLKQSVWMERFDPLFVQYRCYHKRDLQSSIDRYFQQARLAGKLEKGYHSMALWTPFKIPEEAGKFKSMDLSSILESQTLLGIIYSTLYKGVYFGEVSESILAYVLYLLELSLRHSLRIEYKHGLNPSFIGKVCARELSASPDRSMKNSNIIGAPIFVSDRMCLNEKGECVGEGDSRLFSVVRNCLDLAHDDTWFPYASIIDNCAVHIEDVHSLPRKEYEDLLKNRPTSPGISVINDAMDDDSYLSKTCSESDYEYETASYSEGLESDSDGDEDNEGDEDDDGDIEEVEVIEDVDAHSDADRREETQNSPSNSSVTRVVSITAYEIMDNQTANRDNSASSNSTNTSNSQYEVRTDDFNRIVQSNDDSLSRGNRLQSDRDEQNVANDRTANNTRPNDEHVPMDVDREQTSMNSDIRNVPLNSDQPTQVQPENLVMGRRAILGAPEIPRIRAPSQNLAIDNDHHNDSGDQVLSEFDIQARFNNFFNTMSADIHRGSRRRNMARRGGLRANHFEPPIITHGRQMARRGGQVAVFVSGRAVTNHERNNEQTRRRIPTRKVVRDKRQFNESILSLLLRLHAKFSDKPASYRYDRSRAELNCSIERSRIGDGIHFITIVLDLLCSSQATMKTKVHTLKTLLWPDEIEIHFTDELSKGDCDIEMSTKLNDLPTTGIDDGNKFDTPMTSSKCCKATNSTMTPNEKRLKAKEYQRKLMAEFANKQRAFMEKHESSGELKAHGLPNDKLSIAFVDNPSDEPINLSSRTEISDPNKMSDTEQPTAADSKLTQKNFGVESDVTKEGDTIKIDLMTKEDRELSNRLSDVGEFKNAISPECCICGIGGPIDSINPLGHIVLLQSTSVFGHSHLRPKSERSLPCDESEQSCLREETYAKCLERRIDLLCEHFAESSWLDSINIGAEGGVHVQWCGHYLHTECHQSYMKTLDHDVRHEERLRTSIDSDYFLCPVCRKMANSVLPRLSDSLPLEHSSVAVASTERLEDKIQLIASLLSSRSVPSQKELRSSALFCAHLTKSTGPQHRLVRTTASMHSLSLFLTSIARINLEAEIIIRSKYPWDNKRQDCFRSLFQVLALNAQPLISDQWFSYDQTWSHLTGCVDERNKLGVKAIKREVPLLLRDSIAMLLQFLFTISNQLVCKSNFTSVTKVVFNLTVVQSIALVLSYTKPRFLYKHISGDNTEGYEDFNPNSTNKHEKLRRIIQLLFQNLNPLLDSNEEPLMGLNHIVRTRWNCLTQKSQSIELESKNSINDEHQLHHIETQIKLACLPFLRIAALIQHHLYQTEYPKLWQLDEETIGDIDSINHDFEHLSRVLELNVYTSHSHQITLIDTLNWPVSFGSIGEKLIESWSNELKGFGAEYSIAARTLLICRPLAWLRPSLMQLPNSYDDIFMYYYRKKCNLCQQVPQDAAICLICGSPVHLLYPCCQNPAKNRQVHTRNCGASTAILLNIKTTCIMICREDRACYWGSLYMDIHDEEDLGFNRGRPLYLVQARYDLLQEEWLTHAFDHVTNKRWMPMSEF